jgi:outer membrane lipoprotein-sorting protein
MSRIGFSGGTAAEAAAMSLLGRGGRAAALALFCVAASGAAQAQHAPMPAQLTPQDYTELQHVAAYLDGIHTMTARFQQVVSDGSTAAGHLWVQRPGRMRFQYDPPNPLLMFSDAFYVYYWDPELKQTSRVALRTTPAWFLLRQPITFSDDVMVTRFEHTGNTVRVTVVQTANPSDGSLTMDFTENPLVLRQWTVVDQRGRATTVVLSELQFGMALSPDLFQNR